MLNNDFTNQNYNSKRLLGYKAKVVLNHILEHILTSFRFKTKLIIAFLMLSFIPLMVTGFFSYNKSSNAIKTKTSTYLLQIMDQVAKNIDLEMRNLNNYSDDIIISETLQNSLSTYKKMDPRERSYTEQVLGRLLKNKLIPIYSVTGARIVTGTGDFINYEDGYYWKDKTIEKFKDIIQERKTVIYWTAEKLNSFSEDRITNSIILIRQINSFSAGQKLGYMFLAVNEDHLRKIYEKIDVGTNADIFIMDSKGHVISDSNPNFEFKKEHPSKSLVDNIRNRTDSRVFALKMDNGDYLAAYAKLTEADWYIVSTIPSSYLYAESRKIGTYIFYLSIGCLGIALALSFILSNSFSKPIINLSQIMETSDPDKLILLDRNTKRKDEIGILYNQYNNLVNKVNFLINEKYQSELSVMASKMNALEAQINSHFLFNTLECINSIAAVEKVKSIAVMSKALGDMFRYSIKTKRGLVPFEQEIIHVNNYLTIQKYRFDEKINIHYEIDDELRDYSVLKLILQPIVENSISHGLEGKKGKGNLLIKAELVGELIVFEIIDDGVGMTRERLMEVDEKLKNPPQFAMVDSKAEVSEKISIGIKNVDSRIKIYYGGEYGLSIESEQGSGTRVKVRIPARKITKSDGG